MRVVAGVAKGRRLIAPKGTATRPTSDMVREAIFNSLVSAIDLEGAAVADLFAGTGALGIEALSRGASTCVFVDNDRSATETIRRNLDTTRLTEGAHVVSGDVMAWLRRDRSPTFDVVFADPPYAFDAWAALAGVDTSLLVAESDREIDLGEGWRVLRTKRYGSTVVTLFVPRRPL